MQRQMPNAPVNPQAAATGPMQANLQRMADQAFLRDTLQEDDAQRRMSELAEQKAVSRDVKRYGERMAQAPVLLDRQLQPLVKQLGVSAPQGPDKKDKKEIEKLRSLSGPGFDAAYLLAMDRVQIHSLQQFKVEAQESEDPAVQGAAKADERVLAQHLQALQKIADAHDLALACEGKK